MCLYHFRRHYLFYEQTLYGQTTKQFCLDSVVLDCLRDVVEREMERVDDLWKVQWCVEDYVQNNDKWEWDMMDENDKKLFLKDTLFASHDVSWVKREKMTRVRREVLFTSSSSLTWESLFSIKKSKQSGRKYTQFTINAALSIQKMTTNDSSLNSYHQDTQQVSSYLTCADRSHVL